MGLSRRGESRTTGNESPWTLNGFFTWNSHQPLRVQAEGQVGTLDFLTKKVQRG